MTCPHCTYETDTPNHEIGCGAACVGQWCCGCADHPSGKPWGASAASWATHWAERVTCRDGVT